MYDLATATMGPWATNRAHLLVTMMQGCCRAASGRIRPHSRPWCTLCVNSRRTMCVPKGVCPALVKQ